MEWLDLLSHVTGVISGLCVIGLTISHRVAWRQFRVEYASGEGPPGSPETRRAQESQAFLGFWGPPGFSPTKRSPSLPEPEDENVFEDVFEAPETVEKEIQVDYVIFPKIRKGSKGVQCGGLGTPTTGGTQTSPEEWLNHTGSQTESSSVSECGTQRLLPYTSRTYWLQEFTRPTHPSLLHPEGVLFQSF